MVATGKRGAVRGVGRAWNAHGEAEIRGIEIPGWGCPTAPAKSPAGDWMVPCARMRFPAASGSSWEDRVSRYRCIFIDWHNTLSTSLFWGHLATGSPTEQHLCARLRAALYGPASESIVPWMRGALVTEAVMQAVADDTGVRYGLVLAEFIAGCQQMVLVSPAIPALVGALRERGCRVV